MSKKQKSIARAIMKVTIAPLLLLGIATTTFAMITTTRSMKTEVKRELTDLARVLVSDFDRLYPGDYQKLELDHEILIMKGESALNDNFAMIDKYYELTGVNFSIFYGDMRIITTLKDQDGKRAVGTYASAKLKHDVLVKDQPSFYSDTDVLGTNYFAYYEPIYNSDGTQVGMVAALMPATTEQALIMETCLPLFLVSLFFLLVTVFWCSHYSREIIRVIEQLRTSLYRVSNGMLSTNPVPASVLSRGDEFGEMGHSVIEMQQSLRILIEQDGLTHLLNRRTGHQKLDREFESESRESGALSVALGDIDFFKKFNDTYGHDCGDLVLTVIAGLLNDAVKGHGFASRWGGEEFLLVFTGGDYEEHKQIMLKLMEQIRSTEIKYTDKIVHVTMTFGLISAKGYEYTDALIKESDNLLYEGKQGGRDRLVTKD